MKPKTLLLIDRDGTLIEDKKYHLGSQKDWKKKIKFLPTVIQGLKLLQKIPNTKLYMITNQPGVAIKDFKLLTMKRAKEVCEYTLKQLKKKGINFSGFEVCGKSSKKYAKSKPQYIFNKKLVGNFSCIKPNPGMIKNILKKERLKQKNTKIYLIGDRASDIQAILKVKGIGILVPYENEPGQSKEFKKIKSKNKYQTKTFLQAAKKIIKLEK